MTEEGRNHIIAANKLRCKQEGWVCTECNELFRTKALLYEHKHEKHKEVCGKSILKKEGWTCSYCGAHYRTRRELFVHEKSCSIKNTYKKDSLGRIVSAIKSQGEFYCQFCNRRATSNHGNSTHEKYCYYNPNRIDAPSHPISYEDRIKKSIAFIKNKEQLGKVRYSYNTNACHYFDKLNIEKNWHLQHALNGGEVRVGPYSLDAYDKNLNIVVEYNESSHYKLKQVKHDLDRNRYIYEQLNCDFYVYDELNNELKMIYKHIE